MEQFLTDLQRLGDASQAFSAVDVLIVFAVSFGLTLALGWVYRSTHTGVSYSQSFVHTLVLLGVIAAFLMLIIGSNVARAFTLVGTLSLIRFRHAVKETRDIGFVFMALAIGMAVGTRAYPLAFLGASCMAAAAMVLQKLGLFRKVVRDRVLIVRAASSLAFEAAFAEPFRKHLDEAHLISVEGLAGGEDQELIYSVVLGRKADPGQLMQELRALNGGRKVSLVLGQQELDL